MENKQWWKNPFNAGLSKPGRAGAWVVAIAVVAAWNYYENKDNGQAFSSDELKQWNKKTKKESSGD